MVVGDILQYKLEPNNIYSSHAIIVNYINSSHAVIVNYKDNTVEHVPDALGRKLVPLLENSMIVCIEAVVKGDAQRHP